MKKAVCLLMIIVIFLSLLGGCRKDSPSGFVYTEFYSGPETIYPENMPAATEYSNEGFTGGSSGGSDGYILVLDAEPLPLSFLKETHRIDSWYRVSVNRMLTEEEASKLSGRSSLPYVYAFFECTVWYDYIRQEKVERTIVISQEFYPNSPIPGIPSYVPGQSYIMLLGYHHEDDKPPHKIRGWTGPYGGSMSVFYLFRQNDTEYAFRGKSMPNELDAYAKDDMSIANPYYQAAFDVKVLGDVLRKEFNEAVERNSFYQQHKTGSYMVWNFEAYIDQQAVADYERQKSESRELV